MIKTEKARLAALIRKVRARLDQELGGLGSTGDEPAAASSARKLFAAALQEFTAVSSDADDDTIRAAIARGRRWIELAISELDAEGRGDLN